MYKVIFFSLLSTQILASSVGEFITQATPIPNTTSAASNVYSCYNSRSNKVIFSWVDSDTQYPYYDVYNPHNSSFSSPKPISTSRRVYLNPSDNFVSCAYNNKENSVVFAWNANDENINNDKNFYYSILKFPTNALVTYSYETQDPYAYVWGTPFICYNKKDNTMFFSWSTNSIPAPAAYSVYRENGNSFILPQTVVSDSNPADLVYASYNGQMDQTILSWVDDSTGHPLFCVYDFGGNSIVVEPTFISSSLQAEGDVFSCYNNIFNEIIFNWTDYSSGYPYYAVYDCGAKSFTIEATPISSLVTASALVASCYNSVLNQVVFSWADGSYHPYFAVYDCQTRSFALEPTPIAQDLFATENVISSFNDVLNEVTFSWVDGVSLLPYYAVYKMPFPPGIALEKALRYSSIKILK